MGGTGTHLRGRFRRASVGLCASRPDLRTMRRREFLRVASGAAGATAAAASGTVAAQEGTTTEGGGGTGTPDGGETGTGTAGGGGGGGGGATQTVNLVDFAFEPGTEEPLYVTPGTTVEFVWETSTHNIVIDSKPEESDWQGHEPIENAGFTTSHTFETLGEYEFHCQPHLDLGMVGTIIVNEQGAPAEGGGGGEVDPEHMGVPFQAHYVGLATLVGIAVSLVFTFFFLKYGETPHSGYPEEK